MFTDFEQSSGLKPADINRILVGVINRIFNASRGSILVSAGNITRVLYQFTRPANATAYIAKDAIANATSGASVLTFSNVVTSDGGAGRVVSATVVTDQTTNTAQYRLHLYSESPTALNDNDPCTAPLYVDVSKYIGYVDIGPLGTEGSGATSAYAQNTVDYLPFACATSSKNLYGILETLTAFTPASGQKFSIIMRTEVS